MTEENNDKEVQNRAEKIEKGLQVSASILAAAAAGYFLFGPNGKKNRDGVKQWALDAKAEIVDRVQQIQDVGEEEFADIVDAVLEKYAAVRDVSEAEAQEMAEELKANWKIVALEIAAGDVEGAKRVVEDTVSDEVDTIRKKVADEIAPDDEE